MAADDITLSCTQSLCWACTRPDTCVCPCHEGEDQ